jgi:hypothetical protein
MIIDYEIRAREEGYFVGHVDENGEWWDADPAPFATLDEAEAFLEELNDT